MTELYSNYTSLKFNRPETGVLEVILSAPKKLNALDAVLFVLVDDGHD